MSSQLMLSDPEDPELEQMVNRARLTTTVQFYVKDKKDRLTEIGLTAPPAAKK